MSEPHNQILKWEPLPNLPQLPIRFLTGSFDGDRLRIEAKYFGEAEQPSVLIEFGAVEAHEVCEEFSDRLMSVKAPFPRLANLELPTYSWPFLEVQNSDWVARKIALNGAIDDFDWRHFVVLTLDRTLHVMTSGEVETATLRHQTG